MQHEEYLTWCVEYLGGQALLVANQADRQAGRQTGRQAGRQAGRKAGRKAGMQAGRQEGQQTCSSDDLHSMEVD